MYSSNAATQDPDQDPLYKFKEKYSQRGWVLIKRVLYMGDVFFVNGLPDLPPEGLRRR